MNTNREKVDRVDNVNETYRFNRYMADFKLWQDYDRILVWVLSQPKITPSMLAWMFKRQEDYRGSL
jgi:hypothetical protein